MLHPYDPYASFGVYHQYYTAQVGSGTEIFKGRQIQLGHGYGIGYLNGSLSRVAAPFFKSVGKQLSRQEWD